MFTDDVAKVECTTTNVSKTGTSSTATEEVFRNVNVYAFAGNTCLAANDKKDSFLVKSVTTTVPTTLGAAVASGSATSPIISVGTDDAAYAQASTMTDAMKNFVCAN